MEETLQSFTEGLSALGSDARMAALRRLAGVVRQEALVKAFADTFLTLTVVYLAVVVLLVIVRRPQR